MEHVAVLHLMSDADVQRIRDAGDTDLPFGTRTLGDHDYGALGFAADAIESWLQAPPCDHPAPPIMTMDGGFCLDCGEPICDGECAGCDEPALTPERPMLKSPGQAAYEAAYPVRAAIGSQGDMQHAGEFLCWQELGAGSQERWHRIAAAAIAVHAAQG